MNILWATHQSHHSAEDYNLSTALRQGVMQSYASWMFYLPLALVVPPPIFLMHTQMNLLYQFWIHTEIISNLGPLEYILNTPSHHRVHHGRNPYCIDKNYAGVFIIWDRIFGTFAPERENEPIAYGLIHPINTFDPLETQVFENHFNYEREEKYISLYFTSLVILCIYVNNSLKLKAGKINYLLFGKVQDGSQVYLD